MKRIAFTGFDGLSAASLGHEVTRREGADMHGERRYRSAILLFAMVLLLATGCGDRDDTVPVPTDIPPPGDLEGMQTALFAAG